jgi:hypothetical protein
MKRPPHSFVVEVRRQRRSPNSGEKSWAADPALTGAAAAFERSPGAAALFAPEPKAARPPEPASLRPTGRILPSLADLEPVAPPVAAAAPAPQFEPEALKPARKPRAKPQPKSRKAPDREAATPFLWPFDESAPASEARGATAAKAVTKAEAPRGAAIAPRPASLGQALEAAADDDETDRNTRHRRIMDRYVRGSDLRPGLRWKRRLPEARK